MTALTWWHWIIAGMGLMIAQFIIPSFTIVWFGLGALFTGVIKVLWPWYPASAQIFTWLLSSLSFDAMWFKYVRKKADDIKGTPGGNVLMGDVGIIIKGAGAYEKAVVKFENPLGGSDEWPCRANVPLFFGDRVRIVDFSDKVIKVAKVLTR